ncbi:MAG TPA: ComEC/Rec2 family competence protein, partial [Candidatus Dojkabacteria bacterium]|nr:ComEC/Rec2 family competence protein [Candidatus Dojkabacteria bacterium]
NVNILLLGINSILAAVDKKIRSRVSIIVIWAYCILAGLSASIIRATIMASVAIIGSNIGKNRITLNALLITVCIMMIINPFEIYNVGFLLSVGSTLALIVVLPSIEKTIINFRASNILSDYKYSQNTIILQNAKRILGDISTNGTQTIACTLVVLPILIVTFKQVSISTVIANILILPLVELALLIGLIWILINSLIPSLAIFITFIPTLICNLIASILKMVGDIEPVIINNANCILPLLIVVYTMILFVFVLIFYPTVYEKNMGIG